MTVGAPGLDGATQDTRAIAHKHLAQHFASASAWRAADLPVIVRGEGCHLYDDRGEKFIDAMSGLFCVNMGHGRRDLAAAAAAQIEQLSFATNWSAAHPPAAEAAQLIAGLAPGDLDIVFFVNSGTEANESAIKFARQYHQSQGDPRRIKIISRHMAYHGTTLGALSATGIPAYREPFQPLLPWFRQVPNTLGWEAGGDLPAAELPCFQAIEQAILEEGPETVAAILAEPVQNVGGLMVPPRDYWRELRRLCDRYGLLLMADEVICGFGRLGHWFGSEQFGVVPDVISFAKGVTSGYVPLGGVLLRSALVDALLDSPVATFMHGATYGGHPVCTAVAVANVTAMRDEHVLANVQTLEPHLRAGLEKLRDRHRIVKEVRGMGFFFGLELTVDRLAGRELDAAGKADLCRRILPPLLRANGLITRADDRGPAMIMIAPPLVADRALLDDLLSRLDGVLAGAAHEFGA